MREYNIESSVLGRNITQRNLYMYTSIVYLCAHVYIFSSVIVNLVIWSNKKSSISLIYLIHLSRSIFHKNEVYRRKYETPHIMPILCIVLWNSVFAEWFQIMTFIVLLASANHCWNENHNFDLVMQLWRLLVLLFYTYIFVLLFCWQ